LTAIGNGGGRLSIPRALPSLLPLAMDRAGNPLTSVGFNRFGFDSTIDVDSLRALYLRPHYRTDGQDETENKQQELLGPQSKYNPSTKSISYTTFTSFPPVKLLPPTQKKRILITGGAGFVGSHLVDRLMLLGHDVTVLDNFFTGSKTTVSHWVGHPNFELVRHDVIEPFMIECDRKLSSFISLEAKTDTCQEIYHLACPASPPHYQFDAIKTLQTSFIGTQNMLGLAKRTKARFLITSTSGK
jgi:UDP-glucuronate decarboxylase